MSECDCCGESKVVLSVEEARNVYRAAWKAHSMSSDEEDRRLLEDLMDEVQDSCTRSGKPDEDWLEFISTIPGYVDYWREQVAEFDARIKTRESEY